MLITGSGSFAQAFVKRLLEDGEHDRICIYSRGEHKQAEFREKFNNDPRLRMFIGDIRDKDRLKIAMDGVDAVVSSAALKRIEVGYYSPDEVVKTNIIGSMNIIESAYAAKVKKVVFLSSDKAFSPCGVYGQTKAIGESLFLNANNTYGEHGPKYSCVRYGNILGSEGSVVPKWVDAIKNGKPITVTDLNCTRFCMFQEEAVQLVLDTLETMPSDKPAIPKLPAYSIKDLLEAMDITDYQVIGLPDYEKSHECMGEGNCSNTARRMSVDELREALKLV